MPTPHSDPSIFRKPGLTKRPTAHPQFEPIDKKVVTIRNIGYSEYIIYYFSKMGSVVFYERFSGLSVLSDEMVFVIRKG